MNPRVVISSSATLSTICHAGGAPAVSRVGMEVGEVSGNRLSTVASAPSGSSLNALLSMIGISSGRMRMKVNWEPSRALGASAPRAPNAEA